ncbi:hypothetical protein GQ54DRAFT_78379 [Martensiomyces pterosporus]|nr:hypothetical protein GQ54DRAFT_78379 [Martensiomyces pterosporus]
MYTRVSDTTKLGMLAVLSLLLSTAYADDQKTVATADTKDGGLALSNHGAIQASGIIAGVVLIILGLFFNYLGVKIVKLLIFLAGFCVVGGLVLYAEYKIRAPLETIAGGILIFLYKVGIALVGALGGFAVATWILSMKSGGLIHSDVGRIIFIVVMIIIGMIAVLFLERPAIIVASSVWGAYALFVGIDCFAKTGFQYTALTFLNAPGAKFETTPKVYGMIAGMAISALLGIVIQFIISRKKASSFKPL